MNYYDELAVAQDASLDEIRQAYRVLARLPHPDNQSDPRLKSAAELQMVRLNEIIAVLTDPQKRRTYDDSICRQLAVPKPAPPPPPTTGLLNRHWPWGLACCILFVAGLWYLRSNESGDPISPRPSVPAPQALPSPGVTSAESVPASQTRESHKGRTTRGTSDLPKASPSFHASNPDTDAAPDHPARGLPEPARLAASAPGELRDAAPPPAQPMPANPEASVPLQVKAEESSAPDLAGRWILAARAAAPPTPGMYPPEFVELFLSEVQGTLSGKYWARYRIPNQALSPEVQFRVSGASTKEKAATLTWVSDDGGKGQLQVALRGANSMEVNWWTSAFGQRTALTSGTAVLVRQQAQ